MPFRFQYAGHMFIIDLVPTYIFKHSMSKVLVEPVFMRDYTAVISLFCLVGFCGRFILSSLTL